MVFRCHGQRDAGLQRGPHLPGSTQRLNVLVDGVADLADAAPFGKQAIVALAQGREGLHEDRIGVAKDLPGLFGGEAQERCHPAQHGVRDLVQRGLGAAPCQALGRGGVEAVLEHVEVKTAQVFRALIMF